MTAIEIAACHAMITVARDHAYAMEEQDQLWCDTGVFGGIRTIGPAPQFVEESLSLRRRHTSSRE